MWFTPPPRMVAREDALPGRTQSMPVPERHFVLGTPLLPPFPECEIAWFGMGCFWGAEKLFWSHAGVRSTSVGYAGGYTLNPTYKEVCSGRTGHAEVVQVVYDPTLVGFEELLRVFWEGHDPTQGMRQGNDVGTQYRSTVYCEESKLALVADTRDTYQRTLARMGYGAITTELQAAGPYYYAEPYHQQYLAKNPGGYCGHGGTGVSCPVGVGKTPG